MECPIGLDCSMMLRSFDECQSRYRCEEFAKPQELPYEFNSAGDCMTVQMYLDWPEQQLEELKEAGWEMAWCIPYDYYPEGLYGDNIPFLEVHLSYNSFIAKQMREEGWEYAEPLPYHYDNGLIIRLNEKEKGFETADELPYKFVNGAMIVVREHYQLFAPAQTLPYELKKDGLHVIRNEVNRHYYDNFFSPRIPCYKQHGLEYIWMKPEPLQYSYKFSREYQCNLLRVSRTENGFARAWYLKDKDKHFHKGLPVLTDNYPRPDNWKFKKELAELGLKVGENQKPVAYFLLYSRRVRLWDVEDCSH